MRLKVTGVCWGFQIKWSGKPDLSTEQKSSQESLEAEYFRERQFQVQKPRVGMTLEFGLFEENKRLRCGGGKIGK